MKSGNQEVIWNDQYNLLRTLNSYDIVLIARIHQIF